MCHILESKILRGCGCEHAKVVGSFGIIKRCVKGRTKVLSWPGLIDHAPIASPSSELHAIVAVIAWYCTEHLQPENSSRFVSKDFA
jgi:hypothetical protein